MSTTYRTRTATIDRAGVTYCGFYPLRPHAFDALLEVDPS